MTDNHTDNMHISLSDIRVLDTIKEITSKGDNAEVRQKLPPERTKEGKFSVYAVKKSKQI